MCELSCCGTVESEVKMEGGYLPWKNKCVTIVDQLEAIRKPLPPPPAGTTWLKAEDGNWQLLNARQINPFCRANRSIMSQVQLYYT